MGLGETDLSKDGISAVASMISCSICLEAVADNGDRSTAKLQCGHEFHLDCIGSAFNAKGLMQCPNCRKIEKGQWLYANGCRSFPEFSVDDWTTHDEDLYDHSYSEMPFGVHWCPYGGLTRLSSSFEEGELPSTAYHDLLGHRAIFTEHTVASSVGHSCPYIAYFQPLHHSTSNSTESVADVASFHHHWSSLSGLGEHTASHAFPSVDTHYRHWEHHSPSFSPNSQINGTDQASVSSTTMRPVGPDSDGLPSTGSFVHPFLLGHWNGSRAGASVISSMIPPYIGNSRGHSRAHNLRVYHQQLNSQGARAPFFSGARRSNSQRGVAPVGPAPVSSDHSGFNMFPSSGSSGRNLPDAENSAANRFYALERDRFAPYPLVPVDRELGWWGPFHQGAGGSDSGSRNGFWQRNGSERSSLQGRTDNSSFHPVHLSQMHPYL